MSVHDRTNRAAAARLLSRALVVAGATVAGTSMAWLAGAGHPADAAEPSAAEQAPVTAGTTDSTGLSGVVGSRAGADPADSPLGELDPLALVQSGPAQRLLTPVDGALHDSTDGVRQVAENLPVDESDLVGGQQHSEPAAAEQEPSTDTPAPPVSPVPLPSHHEAPNLALPHENPSPEPAPEQTASEQAARTAPVAERHTPEPPRAPARDRTLPATTGTGSAHTADLQQTGAALGSHPAGPQADHAYRGAFAHDNENALLGVPAPRPGASPD